MPWPQAIRPHHPGGSELVRSRFGQPLAVADHAVGARGVIGILPAGTLPVSLYIRVPAALGAGFKASIGLADAAGDISAAADDGGGAWVTDNDAGAAGGYVHLVPAAFAKLVPRTKTAASSSRSQARARPQASSPWIWSTRTPDSVCVPRKGLSPVASAAGAFEPRRTKT